MRLAAEVRRFAARHAVGPGVVAVSGGADSVALLRAMADARVGPLTVAHFNHRLRGADADADAAFVGELAGRLGLPFALGEADVAAAAADARDNLEATARRLRYGWLADVAAGRWAGWVATGHTADDQAETVLHRLVRGTGLQGLRGIAAVRPLPPGSAVLLRPLLAVTRADVRTYLTELGQPFREDATNADPAFTRNRIRRDLLPLLKTFNPRVVDVLGRLAGQADEAFAVLADQARALLAAAERPRAGGLVVLDAHTLTAAPGVVRAALRLVWEREGWPLRDMDAAAWDRATAVAVGRAAAADFPGGVTARHRGRVVAVGPGA